MFSCRFARRSVIDITVVCSLTNTKFTADVAKVTDKDSFTPVVHKMSSTTQLITRRHPAAKRGTFVNYFFVIVIKNWLLTRKLIQIRYAKQAFISQLLQRLQNLRFRLTFVVYRLYRFSKYNSGRPNFLYCVRTNRYNSILGRN